MRIAAVALALALALALTACSSNPSKSGTQGSGGTLIVGMDTSNFPPLDTVATSSIGWLGNRFIGNQLYDGLTRYDLDQSSEVPKVISDLATSWTSDASAKVWTFNLRKGVTFQDGTPFNADAVIFNLDRYMNKTSPYFDSTLSGLANLALSFVASYRKVTNTQVQITTKSPDAHLPGDLTTLYFASPTAVRKEGNAGFGSHPVGTGPFVFKSETQGQQLTMVRNPNYWAGAPKLDELILKPISDPTARIAALRSGEVNWIESPNPDNFASLKAAGFKVLTSSYDEMWPWIFDTTKPPWNNVLVRQAANYAINREAMVTNLLHGAADPAYQVVSRGNSAYTAANNLYSYDPTKAKDLLKQAGYPDGVTATLSYVMDGSGVNGPMNEEIQHELAAVGIKVKLEPFEQATLQAQLVAGKMPGGATATNSIWSFQDEAEWSLVLGTGGSFNVGHYSNRQVDQLLAKAAGVVDPAARDKVYAQAAALITRDAPWLFVVNDLATRALAPSVKGFIQPKSWFIDLTKVYVAK